MNGPDQWRNFLAYKEAGEHYSIRHTERAGGSNNGHWCRWPVDWVRNISKMNHQKKYDFVFIGSGAGPHRKWLFKFIDDNFTDRSFLHFSNDSWRSQREGKYYTERCRWRSRRSPEAQPYCNKSHYVFQNKYKRLTNDYDENYFQIMRQSKFALCPGGGGLWSFRFFEAMLCGAFPIIRVHAERGAAKDARYLLTSKYYEQRDKLADPSPLDIKHNYRIFLEQFTFLSELERKILAERFNVHDPGVWYKLCRSYQYSVR